MLGLILREEFRGKRLKGTQIELAGATQQSAESFLKITYPTADVLRALEAISPEKAKPVVLIGDRGQGKSHIMAVLHHALQHPSTTRLWLQQWATTLNDPQIGSIILRDGLHVVSDSLHRQQYKFLWDLLFDNHPQGAFIRGKWEGKGDRKTDIPGDELIIELLKSQPTAILLDEFQTWYDGLTNTKQFPWRTWAFNFIQILAGIAENHPELLVLIVSVRDGSTDAFQQIHRVAPTLVDFKGPNAKRDRLRLLLHRLFENRINVPLNQIDSLLHAHIAEFIRLSNASPTEHQRIKESFLEAWPFAPHVISLLEDQVLVATEAQETRDLIRILVDLFKINGENNPILTAADFSLENERSGIAALLDSISNRHHATLRDKAIRNLEAVRSALPDPARETPDLEPLINALWLRSIAVDRSAGAEPGTLQIDITKSKRIDDNLFQAELSIIVENSFNIHNIGNRLVFREEENAEAKLKSAARNDKLFQDGADCKYLAKEIRYVLAGSDDVPRTFQVIVLGRNGLNSPWADVDPSDCPDSWDQRIPLVVFPECPNDINKTLATWLRDHVSRFRNIVRFVLPRNNVPSTYFDRDLLILARCVVKSQEWRQHEPEYSKLQTKYQQELRNLLKDRFDRFAILSVWNYSEPAKVKFFLESHGERGSKVPDAINERITDSLFIPEEFERLVLVAAQNNTSVGKFINDLKEPLAAEQECIPWLGEALFKDKIARICAAGKVAINIRDMEYLQIRVGETEEEAWSRMKGRLGTGRHLDQSFLLMPEAVPNTDGASPLAKPTPASQMNQFSLPEESQSYQQESKDDIPSLFSTSKTATLIERRAPATSPLNLLGKVETWGVTPGTQIKNMHINVSSLNGAQLQRLIRELPDGLMYEVNLEMEAD